MDLQPLYDVLTANGEDVDSAQSVYYFDMTSNLGRRFRFHCDGSKNGNVGFLWRGSNGTWIETLKLCAVARGDLSTAGFYLCQYLTLKWDEDRFTEKAMEYSWNVTPWWHKAMIHYKGERPRTYEMVRILEYIRDGRITVPEGASMWPLEPEPEPEPELPVPEVRERVFEYTQTHFNINLRELKRRVRARIRW